MKLNLGCGPDILDDWINIDWKPIEPGIIKWDLNDTPLPFLSSSASEIRCNHILEHLWEWEKLLIDLHRILEPKGTLTIRAPYGFQPCAGHKRFFTKQSMEFFLSEKPISNDDHVLFKAVKVETHRRLPFRYHIKKYLKIRCPYNFPIGKRWEIEWTLTKG